MRPRLILPADADRDEWLEARRQGVTASEIAAILGLSPYESPRSLYHRKRGEHPEEDESDAMRWGKRLEAPIADEFAERHPEFLVMPAGLYASVKRSWQLATPDRLLYEADGVIEAEVLCGCELHVDGKPAPGEPAPCCDPDDCGPCCEDCPTCPKLNGWPPQPVSELEIKCGGSFDDWGESDSDEIPVQYRCQVLWQLDTLGLDEARVALLVSGRNYREYVVKRDEDDIALMRDAARDFLDSVDLGVPPDVDAHAATAAVLKRLHPDLDDIEVEVPDAVGDEYEAACASLKEAKQRKELAENRMREAAGPGRYVTSGGRKIATRVKTTVAAHWRDESPRDYYMQARRTK